MGLIAEYQVSYQHLPLVDVAAAVPEIVLRLEVGQPNQAGPPPSSFKPKVKRSNSWSMRSRIRHSFGNTR